jgi:phage baseplate assembly protein W
MGRGLYMPFQVGDLGVPRAASRAQLVRQQLEQLLFTMPGERVNRPEFGCGVQRLVFGGTGPETTTAVEYTIRVAVKQSLADVLTLDALQVTTSDATLTIDILYTLVETGEERADSFKQPLRGTP